MAVAVASATVTAASILPGTPTVSYTSNKPTGVAVGDLLVAFYLGISSSSPTAVGNQAGYTKITARTDSSSGFFYQIASYYRIADASDVAATTYTFTETTSGAVGGSLSILRITGADTTTPINTSADSLKTSGTTPTAASVTTTVTNTLLLIYAQGASVTANGGSNWASTASSGFALASGSTINDTSNQWYLGAESKAQAASGATGTTAVLFAGSVNTIFQAITLAIAPPAAGSVGASTGAGAASGVGQSTANSTVSSAGAGAATGIGRSAAASTGAASGAGAAAAVGKAVFIATATASGAAVVTAVGASLANSVGASSGAGSAAGVGRSTANGVGSASGAGSAPGIASSTLSPAVGSAVGSGAAAGVGRALFKAVASASGAGLATGVGSAVGTINVGSASGHGFATGVGAYLVRGVGSAFGQGSALGVGAYYLNPVPDYPWHPPGFFIPPYGYGPCGLLYLPWWSEPVAPLTTWSSPSAATTSWSSPAAPTTIWRT